MSELHGRVAGHAVMTLRERTGLIPAHAAQLLAVADGSIDNALELFAQDPAMFHEPQHSLLVGPQASPAVPALQLSSSLAAAAGPAPAVAALRSCRVAAAASAAAPESAGNAAAPAAVSMPMPAHAACAFRSGTSAASLTPTPTDAAASVAVPVLAPASLLSHSRSPFAKARRNKLKKQRKQLQALHAASSPDGLLPQPQVASGHHARLARAEAIGFARGAAAEKAAAKERRGRRRIEKKAKKAGKQAGKRQARRRRAGQV